MNAPASEPVAVAARAAVEAMCRELDALQLSPLDKAIVLLAAADGQARAAGLAPERFRNLADEIWRHCDGTRPSRRSVPFNFDGDPILKKLNIIR